MRLALPAHGSRSESNDLPWCASRLAPDQRPLRTAAGYEPFTLDVASIWRSRSAIPKRRRSRLTLTLSRLAVLEVVRVVLPSTVSAPRRTPDHHRMNLPEPGDAMNNRGRRNCAELRGGAPGG